MGESKKSLGFAQSLSYNGYTKLPNGLILQWGNSLYNSVFTFPIAFPNACRTAIVVDVSGTGSVIGKSRGPLTKTNLTVYGVSDSNDAYTVFAIGN